MIKKLPLIIFFVLVLATLLIGAWYFVLTPSNESGAVPIATTTPEVRATDAKNATYTIGGLPVKLADGVSITDAAPGSATKITTRYFGNDVVLDLNSDGRPDTMFILTQDTGGSGIFYYVVAALNTPDGYVGSHALLLGDRIAPQSASVATGTIVVVNYAERKSGEGFAIPPSVGKSIRVLLDPNTMQLGEVVQNFEGEADPAKMTLNMKEWSWVRTIHSNDTITAPRSENKFSLTFKDARTFSAKTDCNTLSGEYTTIRSSITFSKVVSTRMYCQNSQESVFTKMLSEVQSYHFTSKGELIFDLALDSGSMTFR